MSPESPQSPDQNPQRDIAALKGAELARAVLRGEVLPEQIIITTTTPEDEQAENERLDAELGQPCADCGGYGCNCKTAKN